MHATKDVLRKGVRFVDRKDWPDGPWVTEPDMVSEPPMLLLRQNNGAWAALIHIPDERRDAALELEQQLRSVKLFHPRKIEIVELPTVYLDRAKMPSGSVPGFYMGIFYGGLDDIKPAELHYLYDLPAHMRSEYLSDVSRYVSLAQARLDLDRLLRTMQAHGVVQRIDRSA